MSTSPRQIRLISKEFPWTIDIMALSPITCELVWDALYAGLQELIEVRPCPSVVMNRMN